MLLLFCRKFPHARTRDAASKGGSPFSVVLVSTHAQEMQLFTYCAKVLAGSFHTHARARDAAPRGGSPFSVGLLFKAFARFVLRAAGDFCFLLIIIIGCVLDDATYKIKKGTIYVICRLLGSDVKTNGVGRNGIAPSCFTDTHVFVFKKLSSGENVF